MQSTLAHEKNKFKIFRIILSLFFCYWFLQQFMVADEYYSNIGIWTSSQSTFSLAILSSETVRFLTPQVVYIICFLGVLFSISVLFNKMLLLACFGIWLLFSFLCLRTPFLLRVWMPFLGWTLLALPALQFELWEIASNSSKKFRSLFVLRVAWLIAGLSYFVSGLSKLKEPHWASGNGLLSLEGFPYRTTLYFYVINIKSFSIFLNYAVMIVEIASLPLIFFNKGRFIIWNLLLLMHLGILLLFNIPTITLPMLIFHIFLFDTRWIQFFNKVRVDGDDFIKN